MTEPVAVVAVGGNSLIIDPKRRTVLDQYEAAVESMMHIAGLIEAGWNVVITHGNGPQVGFILRRSELAAHELHSVPLDSCGADTQGAIGYMFQKALHNEFRTRGLEKLAATVVTQVRVERDDPAFQNPTKPIGSFMDESTALNHRQEDGWSVKEDAGRGWRRVVPSPQPVEIVELEAIKQLIRSGTVVIAVGGGGIPVVRNDQGDLVGVEAVIDKDFASALLASRLPANLLLISTAVERVALNFKQPDQVWLDRMTLAEAQKYYAEGHFAKGSMGPKIEACIRFLEAGDEQAGSVVGSVVTTFPRPRSRGARDGAVVRQALITDPPNIERAVKGETGTWIVP